MFSVMAMKPARIIKNKKVLKEMITNEPENVLFQDTSLYNPMFGGDFTPANELPEGKMFFFVLPNEYDRKYFGNIVNKAGRLVVK